MRFISSLLLSIIFLNATPHPSEAATADIDKIISHYSKMSGFESRFRQTKKLESVGMELKGSGVLSVSGKVITWRVIEPAALSVTISPEEIAITGQAAGDGKATVRQTQKFSLKDGVAGSQIAASVRPFLELFSGNPEALKQQFAVAQEKQSFALTPVDQGLPIRKMTVVPDAAGDYIARVIIHEKSGDLMTYDFEKPVPLVQR